MQNNGAQGLKRRLVDCKQSFEPFHKARVPATTQRATKHELRQYGVILAANTLRHVEGMHCRCMACDRPLAKLDPDMGGFIPGPHMPISVTTEPSKNNGVVVTVKDGAGGRAGASRKGFHPPQHSRTVGHSHQSYSGQHILLVVNIVSCRVNCVSWFLGGSRRQVCSGSGVIQSADLV